MLSSVNLNNKPDTNFLNNNLFITAELETSILKLEEENITNLQENIIGVLKAMSNSVTCIGIVAKTNYVIYSKEIVGITDMSYLNIFRSLVKE